MDLKLLSLLKISSLILRGNQKVRKTGFQKMRVTNWTISHGGVYRHDRPSQTFSDWFICLWIFPKSTFNGRPSKIITMVPSIIQTSIQNRVQFPSIKSDLTGGYSGIFLSNNRKALLIWQTYPHQSHMVCIRKQQYEKFIGQKFLGHFTSLYSQKNHLYNWTRMPTCLTRRAIGPWVQPPFNIRPGLESIYIFAISCFEFWSIYQSNPGDGH
jgi:hypothetical protein